MQAVLWMLEHLLTLIGLTWHYFFGCLLKYSFPFYSVCVCVCEYMHVGACVIHKLWDPINSLYKLYPPIGVYLLWFVQGRTEGGGATDQVRLSLSTLLSVFTLDSFFQSLAKL